MVAEIKYTSNITDKQSLIYDLLSVSENIEKNEQLFNITEDGDLLDALIYEQKSLQSRYSYLVKQAKNKNIDVDFIDRRNLERA